MPDNKPIDIVLADDDPDDRLLTQDALKESRLANKLHVVENGEELIDYLRNDKNPQPGLILLDLNMPKLDGREALKIIKTDENLRHIPIVVLTTSKSEEDIFKTYDYGVNSFVTKPVTFEGLVKVMRSIGKYWFEIVELPNGNGKVSKKK